jgi:hypothetical protein
LLTAKDIEELFQRGITVQNVVDAIRALMSRTAVVFRPTESASIISACVNKIARRSRRPSITATADDEELAPVLDICHVTCEPVEAMSPPPLPLHALEQVLVLTGEPAAASMST